MLNCRILNSAVGGYDGNVYESLYENALKNPLNKQDPFLGYEYLAIKYLVIKLQFLYSKIFEASFGP